MSSRRGHQHGRSGNGIPAKEVKTDDWIRVTKGDPWRIEGSRRDKWLTEGFLAKNARPIRTLGDPVLRSRSKRVRQKPAELESLAATMFASMTLARGIGIAAPQIGVGLRMAIMDVFGAGIVAIEPEVIWTSLETDEGFEGCLSIPGYQGRIVRPRMARIRAHDLNGRRFEAEGAEYGAQCLVHEIDHLDGKLYIDDLVSSGELYAVKSRVDDEIDTLFHRVVD